MTIETLPAEVVDQIAAGEVVERPAHMVKELIENSLDAGADEIEVDFDEGGRWVRVKDNGVGIPHDQLKLAVARHATSKIRSSSDIWRVHSYGFRGEALATIGAVSRLEILSRPKGIDHAAWLQMEFGSVGPTLEQGGDFGTAITVSDLFQNVPARLKFLKSEAAEASQIKHVVKGLALANFNVGFRLKAKGKLLEHWGKQESFHQRAEQILGLTPLFHGFGEDGEVKSEVVLAPPQVRERTSRQIWIFVQNRLVQDRALQAAVTDAYRHLMMHGDFPVAVVKVSCPPEQVDINIHPTKSAVKFQQPSQAFRAVHRAARSILEQGPWLQSEKPAPVEISPVENAWLNDEQIHRVQFAQLKTYKPLNTPLESVCEPRAEVFHAAPSAEVPVGRWSRLQVLGQANQTYILAQDEQSLILIDQHAAHERVAFERLMRAWKGERLDVQPYLLPLVLDLEVELAESLMRAAQDLEKLGIQIESAGPASVAVRSAPSLLKESALERALSKLAQEIHQSGGSFAAEKAIGDLCATLACHSVVRAGQPLSLEQMRSLLLQMDEFPLSSFCPHGRPVSVEQPWVKLERDFGRLV